MTPAAGFDTLIDLLAFRAAKMGARPAVTVDGRPLTYGALWQEINQTATRLAQLALQPGDRVLIILPNSREFFPAFYGCQRQRLIAVPIFPGLSGRRIVHLIRLSGARAVVIPDDTPAEARANLQAAVPGVTLLTIAECRKLTPHDSFPEALADDVAFIQYTSGSTGNPKGVQLSHRNLLTNVQQLIAGMAITSADIFVSWLPVYHDMGLILKTMVPFFLAAELYLLPTSLNKITHWLETIQTQQATITAAPDFAYRLCLRHVQEPENFDLSSLRVALNAAEPVRATTIDQFHSKFGLTDVMIAGYGLAEATVGVSTWPAQTPVRVSTRGHVSVGPPFPGVEIQIVVDGRTRPAGEIGEIAIKSPANTRGYFNNPEGTARLFWQEDYILSGDLGYLDEDGFLYIVGRKKNIIIQAGRTLYAEEIEEVANQYDGIRYSAAIGIDRGRLEGEQLYLFAEVREEQLSIEVAEERVRAMVNGCYERFGLRPGRVYLLKAKSIPLTHNGKIQHLQLKERYLANSLQSDGRILFPDY